MLREGQPLAQGHSADAGLWTCAGLRKALLLLGRVHGCVPGTRAGSCVLGRDPLPGARLHPGCLSSQEAWPDSPEIKISRVAHSKWHMAETQDAATGCQEGLSRGSWTGLCSRTSLDGQPVQSHRGLCRHGCAPPCSPAVLLSW